MNKLLTMSAAIAVLFCATTAFAKSPKGLLLAQNGPGFGVTLGQPARTLPPIPAQLSQGPAVPMPAPEGAPYALPPVAGPVGGELYPCVKYRDVRNIAPCAVPLVVSVKDPCSCGDPCGSCAPKCVNVQICVPVCECPPKICCSKDGNKVCYNFGKYRVQITTTKRGICVDYDD